MPDDMYWRPFSVPPTSKYVGREWLGNERVQLGLEVDEFIQFRGEKIFSEN